MENNIFHVNFKVFSIANDGGAGCNGKLYNFGTVLSLNNLRIHSS